MADGTTKQSPFQLAVFGAFFLFGAIGVVMFALYQASGSNDNVGTVIVWGTVPASQYDEFLQQYGSYDALADNVTYVYKSPETFDDALVQALASGTGPDMVLLSNEQIMRNRDRMFTTPYANYSERAFRDTYIDSADVLMLPEGIIARPVAVDPLVLYWNRILLANHQYVLPPKEWREVIKMSQQITKRDEAKNISIATIALGSFTNIANAKDILLTMFMQAGGAVVATDADGTQHATLTTRNTVGTQPMQDALRFFTEFSNPSKTTYTWNQALPEARDMFIAGDLALYVGYASELQLILEQNPNLSFDVAALPQTNGGDTGRTLTSARVYAYAVPLVAKNANGAGILLDALTSQTAAQLFEQVTGLPSPRRDLLAIEQTDPLKATFRASAIQSASWRDPNPAATYRIFAKMSDSVVDGTARMSEATERAQRELQVLLDDTNN